MMLDITAGNRMMWSNKQSPHIVFLDWETELKIPPMVLADNRYCPIRDDVFDCIMYDPPHDWGYKNTWKYAMPKGSSFYGLTIKYAALMNQLAKTPQEIIRMLKPGGRMVFKWCNRRLSLWKVLAFFKAFEIVVKKTIKNNITETYWVTMRPKVHSLATTAKRNE